MKRLKFCLLLGVLGGLFFLAADQEELPFRVNHVSDRMTIFTPGNYAPPSATAVITTTKGLIAVDTGLSPSLAELTKKKIRQELGRDDILYVINTHFHFDHTDGNQVYAGAEIIGHANVPAAMRNFVQGKGQFIAARRANVGRQEQRLKTLDRKSQEALALEEQIRLNRIMLDDFESRYVATPPTKTFDDKMDLSVADLELRLYYFGPAHTDGDILIHIPALAALFVGDLFHPAAISVTADRAVPLAVPRWIEVLGLVLQNENEVKTVIGGHGHVFTREWLVAQHRYIQDLWSAVSKAQSEGVTPQDVEAQFRLEKQFSYLSPHFDLPSKENMERHRENIQTFWRANQKPASAEIERVIRESGPDAARARFKEIRTQLAREYYVDEREFNALGYRFLRAERKTPEAIAVFEMNTEAFPESWNVWDSLAEGYAGMRDIEKAIVYYTKSIELNPDNQNGKDNLSQLRGYKLDAQGETKETLQFQSGQRTGIQGPYLGQTPPGLEPKVFAPGIVSAAGNFEFSIAFSPDGKEVYFTRRKDPDGLNTLLVCRREKDGWTAPEEASFAKGYPSNEPHITPDGKKLYFGCWRQQPGAERPEYGIWVTERTDGRWGEPRFHGQGMYVSSNRNGDLYMTDVSNVAGRGLIRYPFVNGSYGTPERLPAAVNSPVEVAHGFVVPDESFLVFDSYNRPAGQGGEGDLWVCFKKPDGAWGEAINLGDTINTPATNFCPSISPDGKYLFFATCRDIYWVSAEAIKRLRPKGSGK